jgi:hypothetical protein
MKPRHQIGDIICHPDRPTKWFQIEQIKRGKYYLSAMLRHSQILPVSIKEVDKHSYKISKLKKVLIYG